MRRLIYKEVQNTINDLGYQMISKEYVKSKQKLIIKDKKGYYYIITFDHLKSGECPSKFSEFNPYTIQNIKLWCRLNNKPFELLSNKYIGCHKNLKWKCLKPDCGEIFDAT